MTRTPPSDVSGARRLRDHQFYVLAEAVARLGHAWAEVSLALAALDAEPVSLEAASRFLPPGHAIWTYGIYNDEGFDEMVFVKELPDA